MNKKQYQKYLDKKIASDKKLFDAQALAAHLNWKKQIADKAKKPTNELLAEICLHLQALNLNFLDFQDYVFDHNDYVDFRIAYPDKKLDFNEFLELKELTKILEEKKKASKDSQELDLFDDTKNSKNKEEKYKS